MSNETPKEGLEALDRIGVSGAGYKETLLSQVTTQWGVHWDSWHIARDLLQNFYDANKDNVSDIAITQQGKTVCVAAPVPFDLKHLFFIGSYKGADDVGQYGEGFKVAAVCLLRGHGIAPIAQSGQDVLRIRIAGERDEGTQLQPLAYDFFSGAEKVAGSRLILEGCSDELAKALRDGLQNFVYEGNPLLENLLHVDYEDRFRIYSAPTPQGHIFYRRLKRGDIPRIPLSIVVNKNYAALENLITHDRDRRAFGEDFLNKFYKVFAQYCTKYDTNAQSKIVVASKNCWEEGHPLLANVANATAWHVSWSKSQLKEIFGEEQYFARSSIFRHISPEREVSIKQMEADWRQSGRLELPNYFSRFGLVTARSHLDQMERRAQEEAQQRTTHPPTVAEEASIQLLHEAMKDLTPEVSAIFTRGYTIYTVGASETVLGSLREGRRYRSREVFLNESLFVSDFGRALAVFLHEHNHIFGYDGGRGFTDALTELIEVIVRNRASLDDYDVRWQEAVLSVQDERNAEPALQTTTSPQALQDLSRSELKALLLKLPPVQLRALLAGKS